MTSPEPGMQPTINTREFNRLVLPFFRLTPYGTTRPPQTDPGTAKAAVFSQVTEIGHSVGVNMPGVSVDLPLNVSTAPDADLYRRINKVFPADDDEYERLIRSGESSRLRNFAGKVALTMTEGRQPSIAETFAVHAIMSMYASVHTPSIGSMQDRSAYFLNHLATRLAWRTSAEALEHGPDPFNFAQAIGSRTARLADVIGESASWMHMKFYTLSDRLLLRKHVTGLIDTEPEMEVDDFGELQRSNDELFDELRRLKRFSIKSANHTVGDSTWSIHDMLDTYAEMVTLVEEGESDIRPYAWEPHMIMVAIETFRGDEIIMRPYLEEKGEIRPNYDSNGMHAWMDDHGQLYADNWGTVSLRQLYERAGKSVNYEVLRQFLLQRHFDLSVPIEIVVEVDSQTKQMVRSESPDEERDHGIVYSDLLLPRTRILRRFRTPEELDVLDTIEDQTVQTEVPASAQRKQRLHDRVAHPRKLPAGYKPSKKALELAEELGIVLAPGETVVKKHARGDARLGEVVHRAKKRRDDSRGEEKQSP